MNRIIGIGLAALLTVGVLAAIVVSYLSNHHAPLNLTVVHGVIGSEKQPFFQDADVQKAFHDHGYDVQVDVAGSRQIATTVDLSKYDFAFPAGTPAALKIQQDHKAKAVYVPFYTPMAIASFDFIIQAMVQAGVVKQQGSAFIFDMDAYLNVVNKNERWNDIPGNSQYPASTPILIRSTDVRTSNSAAMYLSIASYVANGNNVVQDLNQASAAAQRVAPVFLRQGFTASSSEVPFDDYLTIGAGKDPMVMIYEAQFISLQAAKSAALTHDRMLMYPSPTVYSKHTLVPLDNNGDQIGKLLTNDPKLQQLAVKYGFRTNDPTAFNQYLSSHGVPAPPQLINVIDTPAYDPLETMITALAAQIQGG